MLASRWEPLAEINRLRDEMDRLLGGANGRRGARFGAAAYPLLNLWEDDENLYAEAELPGFQLDDLEIYVTGGNQLSLKGERKQPELKDGTWRRQERGYGTFSRVVELPYGVDREKVSATFKHGVLTMTLPKSEEAKPRRIKVKAE